MALTTTDWIVIAAYLLLNLPISLYYRRRSSGSTEEFFVSGRNVSWWLAGTSMVATTFAADTPLFVAGLVAKNGISGNWLWWSQCLSGMMTVFFFARYWRRAEILTDVEFVELRYEGKARRLPPRIPRHLPRRADELPHPRLGHQSHDQHHHGAARRRHRRRAASSRSASAATHFSLHSRRARAHRAPDLRPASSFPSPASTPSSAASGACSSPTFSSSF